MGLRISYGVGVWLAGMALSSMCHAQAYHIGGFVEGGLVTTPPSQSASDGGLGKLRWGGTNGQSDTKPFLSGALIEPSVSLPGNLHVVADIRSDLQQRTPVDLLDASLRWTPHTPGPINASVQLGAFFPPFGLENKDIGWSNAYTVTNSALGSWVGQELRTIGLEARGSWRHGGNSFSLVGALFGVNDPAGIMLADQGWIMTNRPLGLFDRLRLPDATARQFGMATPAYTPEFREIDGKVGGYAGASVERAGIGRLQIFRYDNNANPGAKRDNTTAWQTRFWEAGFSSHAGAFSILAEGISGDTAFSPTVFSRSTTDFRTAYVLGAWTSGNWRLALRGEMFGTSSHFGEHGRALTTAINWLPVNAIRLTGELVAMRSSRSERALSGQPVSLTEIEPQISLRLSF